jgi:hypothetical protein
MFITALLQDFKTKFFLNLHEGFGASLGGKQSHQAYHQWALPVQCVEGTAGGSTALETGREFGQWGSSF